MSRSGSREAPRAARGSTRPAAPRLIPALPWRSPALIAAALAAAASALISVTYRIDDPDLWQHLAVGRFVWTQHALPLIHQWTWPSWGQPDVNPSWGFEALLWPFWDRGGLVGLSVWRWITTLAAFGFAWAAARQMGARGLVPAFVIAVCALTYRQRSDVRPETLSVVLLAVMMWLLESRRAGGPDRSMALVPIAWAWANTHLSYYIGLLLIALYAADDLLARRPGARRLALIFAGALAISFVNPFGWRALAQPFQYALFWSHEPVFQNIPELGPPDWLFNLRNGLPLLIAGWPALVIWRFRHRRIDPVEWALMLAFTAQSLMAQRFVGFYTVVAMPFLSRDLSEALAAIRRDPPRLPLAARATAVAIACFAVGTFEWQRWGYPPGIALVDGAYPMRACEFMAAHEVRGRGMNQFGMSSWQIYRFWPDRWRLPFMDIHQSGTRADRDLYQFAQVDDRGWKTIDERHHFDYALLIRVQYPADRLLDALDADTAFALVFKDDAAALYVRRAGSLAAVAERFAYRRVPAGNRALGELGRRVARDSSLRGPVKAELDREITESPWHGQAKSLEANLALLIADWSQARVLLDSVQAIDDHRPRLFLRFGLIDLVNGRPREALRQFAKEQQRNGHSAEAELAEGRAWAALGNRGRARAAYRRALKLDAGFQEAADSLAALDRQGGS
ncbi:MAG TPA: hypothetical protein VMJ70_13675 [Candidatus Sulfotelmatobacter sp.]|nr:hypothetical protein [Candidatus Sulfotelmatobacter sp.]